MKLTQLLFLGTVLALFGSTTAFAGILAPCDLVDGNLVLNCGFESGDFTGWQPFNLDGNSGVGGSTLASNFPAILPNSGANFAFFGPVDTTGGITQNIVTIPGNTYMISFYLQNDGSIDSDGTFIPGPTSFDVSFNGVSLYSENNAPAYPYTQFTFTSIATAASTPLTFTFQQNPAWYGLDDVVVLAADVPEPGTIGLLGGGLIGLSLILRRRKRA